jgi:L-ascorbate metabolism protein UlaG (beta-lactamase superfamily)
MGASPTPELRQKLGSTDVLLVPMGDTYTMGPREAVKAARELSGGWVIPMHGADPRIDLPLAPISDFVDAWQGPIVQPAESYRATLKNKASTPTLLNMRAMGI